MARERVLVVEDEQDILDVISFKLAQEGFTVIPASSGEDGLQKAKTEHLDLILLDLMLPGINGLDVCRELKTCQTTRHIPIIMLTAKNEDIDVVTGLEMGADDYVTKPFSPRVLTSRVRAVLRRHHALEETNAPISVGWLTINSRKHQVTCDNSQIDLTHTEFELLMILIRRPGWVFSRAQLIDGLRDGQYVITDRAIDVQVANLRKKLGKCGGYIKTIRGVGYSMREIS